jgi:hypothetical protein
MITLQPIGVVRNSRQLVEDDNWGGIVSKIEIAEPIGAEGVEWATEIMRNYWQQTPSET